MEIVTAAATVILGFILLLLFVTPRFMKPSQSKTQALNTNTKDISKGPRRYNKAEVSLHNKRTDCWVIIKSKAAINGNNDNGIECNLQGKSPTHYHDDDTHPKYVYDVTSYVEEHPGGDAILTHAGDDSTEGFYGPQHGTRVFDIIEDFCIGELEQ